MHCRDTKTFPVVHRHAMVSYIGVADSIVRHNKLLKAQKCLIPLNPIFFRHPVPKGSNKKKIKMGQSVEKPRG